jgi:hypothetical protein
MASRRIDLHIDIGIVIERLAGLRVEAGCPVQCVDILLAGNKGAIGAVKHIEEAIARGMHDELAILAVDLGVDDRVLGDFVEVVRIVRSVLEPPFDLAVDGAESEHACRPLVVARPVFRIKVRTSVPDSLVDRVGLRIIGRSLPGRATAMLPTVLAVLPGLAAGFANSGNSVSPPNLLPGVEIGGHPQSRGCRTRRLPGR